MKKVFLRFYDLQNLGDDLFLHIITNRYKNQFTVVSKSPSAIMNKPNIIVYSKRKLLLLARFIEKYIYPKNLLINKLINKNDLYVYVGGSLFIDNGDWKHWESEHRFYRNLKRPYYILGSNFGPSKSRRYTELVRDILRRAKDVCFRDSASSDNFKSLKNVRTSTDIAFTLDTSSFTSKTEKTAVFSIINCKNRFDDVTADKYEQEIIKLSQNLSDKGYKIVYMSFCKSEGDEEAIRRIQQRASAKLSRSIEVYNYNGDLKEALGLLAKAEIIVGGRFHASVLGLLFSKKILPMAYSDKTINLLNDMGYQGDIVDIRRIDTFDGSKVDFDKIAIHNIVRQIKRAKEQFYELDKALIRKSNE